MFRPVGSTDYGGTRIHTWISASTTAINVHISNGVCVDDESGIHKINMWVGTKRNAIGDLVKEHEVQAGTIHTIDISKSILLDFKDKVECDQCGDDTVVGVECINGASLKKVCQRYASYRVDGSPPTCKSNFVLLGDGAKKGFQSVSHTLKISNFEYALEDRETGIRRVTYELLDVDAIVASGVDGNLSEPVNLPLVDHDGLPTNRMSIPGLQLAHGHTYQIRFTASNYLGMVGLPCLTSKVLIDTTPVFWQGLEPGLSMLHSSIWLCSLYSCLLKRPELESLH
jgi:hypothetical protein